MWGNVVALRQGGKEEILLTFSGHSLRKYYSGQLAGSAQQEVVLAVG